MAKPRKHLPWTRSQKLAVLVIFFVGFNTLSHISSPAYRFYKSYASKLDRENALFRERVKNDFLPMLYSAISNRQTVAVFESVRSNPVLKSSSSFPSVVTVSFDYFIDQGFPAILLDGRIYHVGDDLDGSPIRQISPFCFSTFLRIYQKQILGGCNNDKPVIDI